MTESLELEAKFIIRKPGQLEQAFRMLRGLGYRLRRSVKCEHTDTYFDTGAMALRAAGWAYRSRRIGEQETLYLKSFGSRRRQVYRRSEVTQTLTAGTARALRRMNAGPVRERLLAHCGGHRLHRLFTVDTARTSYRVCAPGSGQPSFRFDVDHTHILPGRRHPQASGPLDFTELEVECDDAAALDVLAGLLHRDAALTAARFSKYERGLHAIGLFYDPPSLPTGFNGSTPVIQLVFAHLREQLTLIRRYEPVAWEGIDAEGVHRMRIAIRRIRAVLKAFREIVAADIDKRLLAELRWLAGQLGHARDADVCETDISRLETLIPDPATIAPYEAHLRLATADAYIELVDAMASPRYRRLMRRLERLCDAGPGKTTGDSFGDLDTATCAVRMVRDAVRRIRTRGDAIDVDSPAEQLHQLRIRAKQFRYLLDFFGLAQPRRWQRAIESLRRLQSLLGEHQDASVAAERHAAFAAGLAMREDNRALLLTMGQLLQIEQDRSRLSRKRFPAAWARFRALTRRQAARRVRQ